MNCPSCKSPIPDKLVISEAARMMQAKGKSKRKYTSEQALKAVNARWAKRNISQKTK